MELQRNWFQKHILNVDRNLKLRWNLDDDGRVLDRTYSVLERFVCKYIGSTWECNGIRVIHFKPFIFNKSRTIFVWGKDRVWDFEYREVLGFEFCRAMRIEKKNWRKK